MSAPSVAVTASFTPAPAVLSDYTPVVTLLVVVHVVATIVALACAYLAARSVKSPTLKSFVRLVPLPVAASFAPLGTRGMWWPATWSVAFGSWEQRGYALAVLLAAVLALLLLCAVIHRLARRLG
jgi:hypothetical protein